MTLIKNLKKEAINMEMKELFKSDNLKRHNWLLKDFTEIMTKMMKMIGPKYIKHAFELSLLSIEDD